MMIIIIITIIIISTTTGTPKVLVAKSGATRRFSIDTASSMSIVQPVVSRENGKVTNLNPIRVMGDTSLKDKQTTEFRLDNRVFRHRFGLCTLPTEADCLLGTDLLMGTESLMDLANQKLVVKRSL
jgi:hypothetical protein